MIRDLSIGNTQRPIAEQAHLKILCFLATLSNTVALARWEELIGRSKNRFNGLSRLTKSR